MSTGLIHDYLLVRRGAERTFAAMAGCWPDAPVHTLLYDEAAMRGWFDSHEVRTSYLQRLPVDQSHFRKLLPLYPRAVSHLDVKAHRLLVSSSSAFAHGVQRADEAVHVCYCHSPFRYAWFEQARALAEVPGFARVPLGATLAWMRRWDRRASRRVTAYIANSAVTRDRIERYWGRESVIVHPPVAVEHYGPAPVEDFFLVVSELVPHKRVDLAIRAAQLAGVRLKIVGAGPEADRLEATAGAGVEFLGRVSDQKLVSLYGAARAFVLPGAEEFGIAAVEAQASGTPVLAVAAGGALETVIVGETGTLVPEGDADALAEALRHVDWGRFSRTDIRSHAQQFSTLCFQDRLRTEVARVEALAG